MKKITFITSVRDLTPVVETDVGLLVECAFDSKVFTRYQNPITIDRLIGDHEVLRQQAADLAHKLLDKEPLLRNIQQLKIFYEPVCVEFFKIFQLIYLLNFVIKSGYQICEFITESWWGPALKEMVETAGVSLIIILPKIKKQNKFKRLLNRIISGKFTIDVVKDELRNVVNYIDPLYRRSIFFKKIKISNNKKNKPWFYSTAINYTNVGLAYEAYFPDAFNFLVSDKSIAGKPLTNTFRSFFSLINFSSIRYVPSSDEVAHASRVIFEHIRNVKLDSQEFLVRSCFLKSFWLHQFFSRHLPQGLLSSYIFDAWLNVTKPSLLIVGNQVFEGYALCIAKSKGIPTILLQHGVIADFFKYSDYCIDYFIVKGSFFYERLSKVSQKRAYIINTIDQSKVINNIAKTHIILVTMPLYLLPVELDFDSILETLLLTISKLTIKLVIRVHPLERVIDYKVRVERILLRKSINIIVEYSQLDGLNELLDKGAAVIMFYSTVFLDCVRRQIPIIGFNWHEFGFKNQIKQYDIFNFSESLIHFSQLIIQASLGLLNPSVTNVDVFLEKNSVRQAQQKIADIIKINTIK